MVALTTTLNGNDLQIVNDPEDGNYTLVVQVRARDGSDASSTTSRTTAVDVNGFREVIDGLEDASAGCWRNYLKQFQRQPSPIGAVAAALYAQLRRPGDPLWDPDPGMTGIGVKVAVDDPTITAVAQWKKDIMHHAPANPFGLASAVINPGDVSTSPHEATINPHDATIDPVEIATSIQDQLRSIPTKFGH